MSRKVLAAWVCAMISGGTFTNYGAWADANGFEAYRQGNYPLASQLLLNQTGKDPLANYYMGKMRLYGYGELRNDSLAFRYFEQAAEKGVAESQLFLARYYLIQKNEPEKAYQWFRKAAAKGSVDAQLYCAAASLYGFGTKKNMDNQWQYLLDAAKSGDATGQWGLAEHFFAQKSVRNKKLGLGWLNKSVQQNNPRAQYRLAELYEAGTLIKKNNFKANELLNLAAKQSYATAMTKLGEMALKQNMIDTAHHWLTQAVSYYDPQAQFLLGSMYLDPQNKYFKVDEGVKLVTQAAEKGFSKAQEKLSIMYKNGQNVPLDVALADQWQKKSKEVATQASPKIAVAQWLSNNKSSTFNFEGFSLEGIYHNWKNTDALKENNYNTAPQIGMIKRSEVYKPDFKMISPQEISMIDYLDKISFSAENKNPLKIADLKKLHRYPIDPQIAAIEKQNTPIFKPNESNSIKENPGQIGSPNDSNNLNNSSNLNNQNNPSQNNLNQNNPNQNNQNQNNLNQNNQHNPLNSSNSNKGGGNKQAEYQNAVTDLYNKAILGETSAQFEIGQLYHYGIGLSRNIPQALIYYRLAALQQDLRAEYNLGLTYLEGLTSPIDYNTGMTWLNSAAFKGNMYAQYALAVIYENGLQDDEGNLVVQADPEQAVTLFYLAAANHYGPAEYRLANYLSKNIKTDLSVSSREKKFELIRGLYANAVKSGVAEASLPLAFYDAMDKNPEKQRAAHAVAENEANRGNSEGALLMGIMAERGLGIPANQLEALHWYQKASLNPVSAFVLGTYYSEGKGLAKDVEKGKSLLSQAADAGFSYANLNLGVLKHTQGEDFLSELEKALQRGNSTAGLLLADYYLAQSQDNQKLQQAQEIYRYFAEKGDRNAQLKLGYLFDKGIGAAQNIDLAAKWYTAAAEQGLPYAQFSLGQYYQLGKIGGKPNYEQAKKWYAAASADSRAANALGFIYDTVDYNYEKALKNYELASKDNDSLGLFNLGLIYEYGKGTPVDYERAKNLYTQAAELGHPKAMNQLANLYFHGLGVNRDEKNALKWYRKAADLGDTDSLYQLGLFSETGIAEFNLSNALKYYEQASDKGNNEKAKLALARMYQYGIGVNTDAKKAMQYYQELASNNNAYAQYQLALMHFDNPVVANSNAGEGKKLLQKADANGSSQARRVLQWLDVQQQERVSFIEPIQINQDTTTLANQSPESMYLYAISEWNRGDEALSRQILDKVVSQYPKYVPAKKVYEQLTQPKISSAVNVTKQDT